MLTGGHPSVLRNVLQNRIGKEVDQDNKLVMKKFHVLNTVNIFHQSQGEKIIPAIKRKYKICQETLTSTDVIAWEKGH